MLHYRDALRIRRDINDVRGAGETLDGIGQVLHGTDRIAEGRRHWHEALVLLDRVGDPHADQVRARLAASA